MNVLLLTDGIVPFQLGGMQKHSLLLAKFLAQKGCKVVVLHCGGVDYSPQNFQAAFSDEELKNIEEIYIKFPKTDPFPGHYIRENKVYSRNAFDELEERIDQFDLIYGQGFTAWHFIKEKHKRKFNLPILVNFHGFEMFQSAPSLRMMAEYALLKNSVKWNVRNADFVYSFGGKIDLILADLGIQPHKILHQFNGIHRDWLVEGIKPSAPIRKFVFIGRAERRKGIEELTAALHQLIAKDYSFEFHFIGPVNDKFRVKDARVHYHGEIRDQATIKEIVQAQDCLVCPSHSEGMPTVILESMASGLAIIGTNVGAIERQINENGILLENPELKGLVNALVKLIELDDEALTTMKSKSIALVESNFLWEKVIEKKLADFKECLSTDLSQNKSDSSDTE
jgi:glycosyltransferase involved in cell wall biosynthesis